MMALAKVRTLYPETVWRLPDTFWTATPRALGAEVAYEGVMPSRPADYYDLGGRDGHGYVYLLSGFELLYIGKSWCPGNRFDRHRRRLWWPGVRHLTLLRVRGDDHEETGALMDGLETFAIRRLLPVHNIAKVVTSG